NEQTTHGTIRHWDALELGCLAQQRSVGGCTVPQGVDSVEDFDRLESSLLCTANRVEARLEELALLNVPRGIADDLAAGTLTNTFPENRGEYGEAVSRLRGSVESVGTATRSIANALRSFSMTLSVARAQIAIGDLQESIQLQQAIAAGFAHYTSCANAIANGGQDFAVWTNAAIAVNECKDAAVQIAVIAKTKEFQEAIASYEDRIVFQQIMESLADHSEQIQSASDLLAQSYAQINESLTRIDQIRSSASRALAKTLFLESDAAGREYHVNRVMRARMNTLRVQYEAALEKAKQNAWIARRALEQRIGMNLDAIEMDLQFVEAPASWVDEVCTLTGIDYDAIRSETAIDERGYADAFIGDYVDRLGRVLQSYSFDFPHDDGADVAVLSLRDGIDQTRVACDMRGWNELTWSVDPSAGGDAGWQRVCAPGGHCLAATALAYGPFEPSAIEGSPLTGVQARALGGAQAVELETTEVDLPDENLAFDPLVPEWQQAVFVPTGRYLLSWYERIEEGVPMEVCEPVEDGPDLCTVDYLCTDPAAPLETQLVANVRGEILPVVAPLETVYLDAEPYEHSCYRRTAVRIDNPVEQWVTVSFAHRYAAPDMLPSVGFAAPQLEALPFDAELPLAPQPFFATDDDLLWPAGLCEDTEGGSFRNSWVYACEALCPEGIGAGCEPTEDNQRCFYEKVFDLSLAGIEGRALLPSGGLAVGNYNYRHHRVGVNVVGTGVLDCANADFPSSCHGSAFLNVALRHEGPFTVRNHVGESYEAPLFPSEVEHAKALTAERYLTNPISSADEALLSRYWRGEFFGRPLDGTYRVRVYDTDALVWERVQDVQLVLDYRYWSRAN
ncbi:MAG: methyl-accepting chemotaxis protein, partial [Myxococcota bacterium]